MNSTTAQSASAPVQGGGEDRPESRGHLGWIVAGSLATGLVTALLLAAAPFIPPTGSALIGAVLCGFALGWAMLALLSTRFTDQPQRWAAAPALFMGLSGLVLLVFGSSVHGAGADRNAAGAGNADAETDHNPLMIDERTSSTPTVGAMSISPDTGEGGAAVRALRYLHRRPGPGPQVMAVLRGPAATGPGDRSGTGGGPDGRNQHRQAERR